MDRVRQAQPQRRLRNMHLPEFSERASQRVWLATNFAVIAVLSLLRGYMDRSAMRPYGDDLRSFSLLLDQYRESGFVLGIKNDWMDGLGSYTYHWNPMLQPEMVLGALGRPTYEFGVTMAFILFVLFASTLFLARSLGLPTTMSLQAGWLVFMLTATPWGDMVLVEPPYLMMVVWLNVIVGIAARVTSLGSTKGSLLVFLAAITFAWICFIRPFAVPFILPSLAAQLVVLIAYRRRSRNDESMRGPSPHASKALRISAVICVLAAVVYAASFLPLVLSSSAATFRATQDNGLMSAFGGYIVPVIDLPSIDASGPLALLASLRRYAAQFLVQVGPALFMVASLTGAATLIRRGPVLLRNYAISALVLGAFFVSFALLSQIVSTTIRIRYSVIFALPQWAICATAVVYWMRSRSIEASLSISEQGKSS